MYEYIAVVRSIHDGDTFKADIDLGFGIWFSNQSFRLLGVQAWELKDKGGPEAQQALAKLMPVGSEIVIRTKKDAREKFGRYLATVLSHGGDVATSLVAGGHAVYWDGHGPRPDNPADAAKVATLGNRMLPTAYPSTIYDLPPSA